MRPLTEYCTLNMGQSPDSKTYNTQGKGLPFYQGNADFGETHPITHVWCSAPVKVAEDGDILISVRAPIGAMNMAVERCCIGRGLAALTPIRNKCSKQFLYYALQSKVDSLIAQGTGSTFKAISKKVLEATCIPAYSTIEQEQIAETIGHVDNTIAARRKQLALLDQLVKSRFIELFGDPISNPLGWPVKRLDDISVLITNGNTPKGGSDNYVSEGIVFLRSQNVWRNKIDLDDVAYIDAATHADMAKSSLHDKDILITKTGRINTENSSLGRAALFRGADNSANINGHVYLVRLDGTTVPEYVVAILTGEPYRRYIRKVCVGGIDKRQINLDQVEDFPIILPPMKLQEQFAAFVEQTDKSKYYSSLSFRYCQAAANTYRQEWMTCRTSDF